MQRLSWLNSDLTEQGITDSTSWCIAIITCFATLSVISGLDYGIKTISQTAFLLGNFLLLTVFFLDAPWYLLNVMVQSLGYHIQHFIEIGFYTDAFAQLATGEGAPNDGKGANQAWMDWWTIFYWGWWISWAPFVGTFMARISRGRTIRNVFLYTLSVPFVYAIVWFGTFGGAAIRMHRRATFLSDMGLELHNSSDFYLHTSSDFRPAGAGKCYSVPESLNHADYAAAGKYVTDTKVSPVCAFSYKDDAGYWFDLMGQYHGMGPFLVAVSLFTTVLYFVTSSDSGSLVVDLIANNGRESHVVQRVFWAITEGAVALALLRAGGPVPECSAVHFNLRWPALHCCHHAHVHSPLACAEDRPETHAGQGSACGLGVASVRWHFRHLGVCANLGQVRTAAVKGGP
ncbi:unnamed protein product [Polarella glacialis]|uniref:Uncharacterized protein n=1 Tax=Polarella glacialis TaxID=89957 RepID=A0A813G759_POLGL|nr:unnamed protein product [Polarella glacialis]